MEKLTENIKIICLQHPFGREAVIEVLSQAYWVVLMGNGRVVQWFVQKAS